jgi:hypothetical protein
MKLVKSLAKTVMKAARAGGGAARRRALQPAVACRTTEEDQNACWHYRA